MQTAYGVSVDDFADRDMDDRLSDLDDVTVPVNVEPLLRLHHLTCLQKVIPAMYTDQHWHGHNQYISTNIYHQYISPIYINQYISTNIYHQYISPIYINQYISSIYITNIYHQYISTNIYHQYISPIYITNIYH